MSIIHFLLSAVVYIIAVLQSVRSDVWHAAIAHE